MKERTLLDMASANLLAANKIKDETEERSLCITAFLVQQTIVLCLRFKLELYGVRWEQVESVSKLLGECKKYRQPAMPKELEEWLAYSSTLLAEWEYDARYVKDYYVGITRLNDAMHHADQLVNEMQDYISSLPKDEDAGCNQMNLE